MRASPCSMRCVEDLRARWPTAFAPVSRGPPLRVEVARSDLVNCWSLRKREPAEPRRTAAWHGVPAGTWRAALDQANDVNGVAAWPVSLDCITPYWVLPRWHSSCGSVSAGGCGKSAEAVHRIVRCVRELAQYGDCSLVSPCSGDCFMAGCWEAGIAGFPTVVRQSGCKVHRLSAVGLLPPAWR